MGEPAELSIIDWHDVVSDAKEYIDGIRNDEYSTEDEWKLQLCQVIEPLHDRAALLDAFSIVDAAARQPGQPVANLKRITAARDAFARLLRP